MWWHVGRSRMMIQGNLSWKSLVISTKTLFPNTVNFTGCQDEDANLSLRAIISLPQHHSLLAELQSHWPSLCCSKLARSLLSQGAVLPLTADTLSCCSHAFLISPGNSFLTLISQFVTCFLLKTSRSFVLCFLSQKSTVSQLINLSLSVSKFHENSWSS